MLELALCLPESAVIEPDRRRRGQSALGEKVGFIMACNFRISVHKNSDNLHLKLTGDFDDSSACQLINSLKTRMHGVSRVFIHTGSLKDVYPFGRDVFQNNLDVINGQPVTFVFTGEKAAQLAPENKKLRCIVS